MTSSIMILQSLLLVASLLDVVRSFPIVVPPSSPLCISSTTSTSSSSRLLAKARRVNLEDIDDTVTLSSNRSKKGKKGNQSAAAKISPALAQWASSSSSDNKNDDDDDKTSASSSKKQTSSRRVKQSIRQTIDMERDSQIQACLKQLEEAVANEKPNIDEDILLPIQNAIQVTKGTNNLQAILVNSNTLNYRLAWVGSDAAICHVGTGLHKVPLARMQEVFLTVAAGGRVTLQEVIRILGPFPNIKNELKGTSKATKTSDAGVTDWTINWDSMIDGTGKEISAGKEVRQVDLQVIVAEPSAIIAIVPRENKEQRQDLLEEKGEHVLVFIKENEMDEKLEALRVA